jgi:hypothetical protein
MLIKGQSSDIWAAERRVPLQLAGDFPGSHHDVVVVWADPAELDRRALVRADERSSERDYWLQHHGNSATELTRQLQWTAALGMAITWVRAEGGRISIGERPMEALFVDPMTG